MKLHDIKGSPKIDKKVLGRLNEEHYLRAMLGFYIHYGGRYMLLIENGFPKYIRPDGSSNAFSWTSKRDLDYWAEEYLDPEIDFSLIEVI